MKWATGSTFRPATTPVTATLDEAEEASEAFESVSSVAPVNFIIVPTADFVGRLHLEIFTGGALWHGWQPLASVSAGGLFVVDTPLTLVPEGYQVRAVLSSVSAGSVDVTIFQGRAA